MRPKLFYKRHCLLLKMLALLYSKVFRYIFILRREKKDTFIFLLAKFGGWAIFKVSTVQYSTELDCEDRI